MIDGYCNSREKAHLDFYGLSCLPVSENKDAGCLNRGVKIIQNIFISSGFNFNPYFPFVANFTPM